MRRVRRGGSYLRVCSPSWKDPSDTRYAKKHLGRFNPPGEFGALYLSADIECARANARRHVHALFGESVTIFDLLPASLPDLQEYEIASALFVDAVTKKPPIRHKACQEMARAAYESGEAGIAARSAVLPESEELAIFDRFVAKIAKKKRRRAFSEWYP